MLLADGYSVENYGCNEKAESGADQTSAIGTEVPQGAQLTEHVDN